MSYNYRQIANEVLMRNLNLFDSYDDWTKGAFSLSNLGELGKEIFFDIARLSPKFNARANELKFSQAIKKNKSISIGTFLYMAKTNGIEIEKYKEFPSPILKPIIKEVSSLQPEKESFSVIPWDYLIKSRSNESNFILYLCGFFDVPTLERMATVYALGATKNGGVIFWQIDRNMKIRDGKIINYNSDTGHRANRVNWVSFLLHQRGVLKDFSRLQCMFGEHLLSKYPDKPCAIVEAEKTAFICSLIYPKYNWLAVGGEMMFTAERLRPLEGRRVVAFPDAHPQGQSFKKWQKVAESISPFTDIMVSDYLELKATPLQKNRKIDIADLLMAQYQRQQLQQEREEERKDSVISGLIRENPSFGNLYQNFNLELINN